MATLTTSWQRLGRSAIVSAGNATMYAALYAKYSSQSTTNNTSIVNVELRIEFSGSMSAHCYTHTVGFTGGTFSNTKTVGSYYHGWDSSDPETYASPLLSATQTISHNTDGTKTIKIGGTFSSTNGWSATISNVSCTLPQIPRGFSSTPTLTISNRHETDISLQWGTSEDCSSVTIYYRANSASSYSTWPAQSYSATTTSGTITLTGLSANTTYNIYAACTKRASGVVNNSGEVISMTYPYPYIKSIGSAQITLPAPSASYSQSVVLENPLGRTNVTVYARPTLSSEIVFGSVSNSSSALTNLTLPLTASTMYGQIPNSTSGNMVYYCVYNDGISNHFSSTVNGTYITSATNCGPTVSGNISYANATTAHASLVGSDTIIQGQSSFTITAPTTTARGSASITKYYFRIGSGTYESVSTNSKTYSSTNLSSSATIYCYAEDSRGYTSIVSSKTMRIIPYSAPSASFEVSRSGYTTNGLVHLNTATRSQLTTSSSATDVNNWMGNSSKISLSISPSGPTMASTIGGTGASLSNQDASIANLGLETQYTVTVNISDKITNKTLTFKIDKAQPILSILETPSAVGVNSIPGNNDDPGLYVNGVLNVASGDVDINSGDVQFLKASGNNGTTTNIISDNIKIGTTASGETSEVDLNGNVDVSGTFDVVGNTTVTGTLGITGNTTITGTESISSNATVGGTLGVTGNTTVGGNLNVSGDTSITGDLLVDGVDILTTLNNKAVIESGYISTGDTGYYVKFSDGTMITRHTKTGTASVTTAWGSGYTTGANNTIDLGNFPVAFLSGTTPYIWVTIVRDDNNYWMGSTSGTSETNAGKTSLLRFTSSSVSYRFRIFAMGRWK